jgi:probable F420-dependent oxidoreductase
MSDAPLRKFKVSVQVSPQHGTYQQMREAWVRADDLGADVVFTWDHFFPLTGEPNGLHFEAWTLLGAMGEVVKRAQIGTLVTSNTYRNPNLLADMARTVDHISGGRLILGIGSGWNERDHFNYGYDFGTAASRLQDLKRDMPIIRERLGKLNPGPVHGRLPIMIGGGGEKVTLRIVAEHADIWHCFGDAETAAHKSQVLDGWLEKIGRDPVEIERSVGLNPERFADIDKYVAAGFTHFTTGTPGPDFDLGFFSQMIEWRNAQG